MSDGSSIIPLDPENPYHPGNLIRRLEENRQAKLNRFNPGTQEDYVCMPHPRDPSHPDFDGSFDNWQDHFAEMIGASKGRYLMLNILRLGMIRGRVDVLKSPEGEFIFQTGERIFYSIRYDEISGVFVRP